jgi:hypothetical protein
VQAGIADPANRTQIGRDRTIPDIEPEDGNGWGKDGASPDLLISPVGSPPASPQAPGE